MIPNAKTREVSSSNVQASSGFGISMNDATHIMTILRDTLYSDKVLAVLREYSANAWDANKETGLGDTPIKVTLPTSMDPTLVIRDFGPGLSQDDVLNVYTQYGASTKRGSNSAVGMLGIGSKSGFAYSDSFTVESHYGGEKSIYVAVLDESNAGTMQLLDRSPSEETGIAIRIAVRPEDIREFHTKARELFRHFVPRPVINIDLPASPSITTALKSGAIHEDADGWVAVMGCIPYRVNLNQLRGMDSEDGVAEFVHSIGGTLHFDIGEVEINASREELKYSKKTNKIIAGRINRLVEEFVKHTLDGIENDSISMWDKRIRAQVFNRLLLPVPNEWKDLANHYMTIKLPLDGKFNMISASGNFVTRVRISDKFRILLMDDTRKLKGFELGPLDMIAKPTEDITTAELRSAVEAAVKSCKMDGVPIALLSSCPWNAAKKSLNGSASRKKDKKHTRKSFVLKDETYFRHPYSSAWEIADRASSDEDVFVILSKFRAEGYDLYNCLRVDRILAKQLDCPMPSIYGYKTTSKKPVTEKDCEGTEYSAWRKKFHKGLNTGLVAKYLDDIKWSRLSGYNPYYTRGDSRREGIKDSQLNSLVKGLGSDHPITKLHSKISKSKISLRSLTTEKFRALSTLYDILDSYNPIPDRKNSKNPKKNEMDKLLSNYPLLRSDFSSLWRHNSKEWFQYIRVMDKYAADVEDDKENNQ